MSVSSRKPYAPQPLRHRAHHNCAGTAKLVSFFVTWVSAVPACDCRPHQDTTITFTCAALSSSNCAAVANSRTGVVIARVGVVNSRTGV
eukprot:6491227-Pyramimonas_sp.AAC.1